MSEQAAVLFANDAFYVAFMSHDIKAMDNLWARSPVISCIHPGCSHLSGRDVVIESWNNILANHDNPSFTIEGAQANIHNDVAVVICYETFKIVTLVATNIFVREEGFWRIMHHQASATPLPSVLSNGNQIKTIQ